MSLVRLAIRIAAVEALKGRLFDGVEVLDSEIGAIDVRQDGTIESGQEKRFVAVYTQGGKAVLPQHGPREMHMGGSCEVIFEAGITATMMMRDPETEAKTVVEGVPGTDAAFEFYLDLVDRQIVDALSDSANEWADIWRGLCPRVVSIERSRVDNTQQVRLAGHQVKLVCEMVDEPLRGVQLEVGGAFARFMEKLDASTEPSMEARLIHIRAALGEVISDEWLARQRSLGLTGAENMALSGRDVADEDGEAVETGEIKVEIDGLDPITVIE